MDVTVNYVKRGPVKLPREDLLHRHKGKSVRPGRCLSRLPGLWENPANLPSNSRFTLKQITELRGNVYIKAN